MALSTSEGLLDFPSGYKGLKLGPFNLAAPGLLQASLSWGYIPTAPGLSQFQKSGVREPPSLAQTWIESLRPASEI